MQQKGELQSRGNCCNTQRNLIQHVNMSTYILRLDTLVLIRWTGFFVPHGGMKMEPRQLRSEGSWTTLRFTLHPDTRSSKWKRVTMHYTFFFSLKCSAALIDTSLKALCLIRFSNSLSHTCTHSSVKDMIWYNPPVEKKKWSETRPPPNNSVNWNCSIAVYQRWCVWHVIARDNFSVWRWRGGSILSPSVKDILIKKVEKMKGGAVDARWYGAQRKFHFLPCTEKIVSAGKTWRRDGRFTLRTLITICSFPDNNRGEKKNARVSSEME